MKIPEKKLAIILEQMKIIEDNPEFGNTKAVNAMHKLNGKDFRSFVIQYRKDQRR